MPVMRHAEQGRQMQYVDLKMTESMLHTRMQYAYLQRCHICSIAYGLDMPVMQQGRSSPWKMIPVDAVDARMGADPPPRGRSRPPPPATPAKAAPKRPSPPPPRTRFAEAKAAPNDLSGPATPATVATAPPSSHASGCNSCYSWICVDAHSRRLPMGRLLDLLRLGAGRTAFLE